MAEQDDDAHYFESISAEVIHRVFSDERNYTEAKKTWTINASSFQAMAQDAQEQTDRLPGGRRCVVSMKGTSEANFTKKEHLVPEGLGFDWTAPGPGMGTCDEVNARFSKYECEWLRQGKMGIFRPFFVGEGKDDPPAYYAPTKGNRQVWFTRDEKTGKRTLFVSPEVPEANLGLPDQAGPARLVIRVPHNEARTEWVSLALHKMALLMFWLCEGPLAFDAAFADARRFLIEPGEKSYRAYMENMVEGASPGVELHYLVVWRPVGGGRAGIQSVQCGLRAHHMKYIVVLAGEHVPAPPGLVWTRWVDPTVPVPDRMAIAFGMSGLARVPAKPRPPAPGP